MRKIFRIIFIGVVVIFLAAFLKDQLIRIAVETAARTVIGARVSIDGFSLGIFKPAVNIKGLKIYNPRGFPPEVLLDLPKIKVSYSPKALLKGRMHLYRVEVELKEMVVVRNQEGKLNVDSLKVAQEKDGQSKPMPMQIDLLSLKIG